MLSMTCLSAVFNLNMFYLLCTCWRTLQRKKQRDVPCRGLERRCRMCPAHTACRQWPGPSAGSTPWSQQPGRRAYSDPSLVLDEERKQIMEKFELQLIKLIRWIQEISWITTRWKGLNWLDLSDEIKTKQLTYWTLNLFTFFYFSRLLLELPTM